MCLYDVLKYVEIINLNQNKSRVVVDACISEEIQQLNNKGVITLACCCGHGEAGEAKEYKNGFGSWKSSVSPPHTLISGKSVELSKELGYRPFPYYYADGESYDTWQIHLNTGCMTRRECEEWHSENNIPYESYFGVIE